MNTMLGEALCWAPGPAVPSHHNGGQPYQTTVDDARAYAAELGPDLSSAFDQCSDKTPLALRAYIASVFQEGHSYSEVESIRDAMKQYFEDKFHCLGAYWQFLPDQSAASSEGGERQGEWVGNPVFDMAFVSMMQELKDQDENEAGIRHAKRRTAIGYEDMVKLMNHLQKPKTIETEGLGRSLFFQAFATTAFTLWLTFDELLSLRRGQIHFQRSSSDGWPWCTVTLPFRNSSPIDRTQANIYDIHPQMDAPQACCVAKLLQWIKWVETQIGWSLQANDYLFPVHSKGDQIQLEQPFSASQVSTLLNKYAKDAGIMDHRYNRLDTHCFRRGGGQFRLAHAKDPWPFKAIKWWGGWAEREPAEKIVEYLLDDSQYETSYGDMISPHRNKYQLHAGIERIPAEMMVARDCFKSTIRSMEARNVAALAKMEKEVQELKQQNTQFQQESLVWRNEISLQMDKVIRMLESQESDAHCERYYQADPDPTQGRMSPSLSPSPQQLPEQQHPPLPSPLKSSPSPTCQNHPPLLAAEIPGPQRQSPPQNSQEQDTNPLQSHLPTASIPPISHWKDAIKQWYEGDPEKGLDVPLSKWTLAMKASKVSFYRRQMIAMEFESLGCSESRMRKAYGDSLENIGKLITVIRRRRMLEEHVLELEEEEEAEEGPEVVLPNVPKIKNWRQAVDQWEKGDPARGLAPIRDWPKEWLSSPKMKALYEGRRLVATEFEFCERDEGRMRTLHGKAADSYTDLSKSISVRLGLRQRKSVVALNTTLDVDDTVVGLKMEEEEETLKRKRRFTAVV